MERRRRRLAVLCAHLRPTQLSASLCSGGGGGAAADAAAAAAAAAEEEVSEEKGCVFCAIVRGESPAFKVYEDDVCLCILDSNPLSHGHSLIIPKCHFPSLEATPPPVPSKEQTNALSKELCSRSKVPDHVFKAINALPVAAHPMTQFANGVMALQVESEFQKAYDKGIPKAKFWEPTYDDCMNLVARLPVVASYVYRSDHEGGNVSAHTGHLVASALSDPYLSFAAALNGLAGPLHGLANQEVLLWIKSVVEGLCLEDFK